MTLICDLDLMDSFLKRTKILKKGVNQLGSADKPKAIAWVKCKNCGKLVEVTEKDLASYNHKAGSMV